MLLFLKSQILTLSLDWSILTFNLLWGAFTYLFIYSHVYTLFGLFLHPAPYPVPPQFQADPVLPLSLILLKKKHKLNKEDKVFLQVELRIAIQRNS
jgi:hypothetical protein